MGLRSSYKQTEIGVIPEDWEVRPLLSAVRIATGQVDPKVEPYRSMILVAPDHVESNTGRLLRKVTASDQQAISGKYLFNSGDIVYSKIRPYLKKATLVDFDGLCSADMYPLSCAADVSPSFIMATLLAERFTKYAENVSTRSGIPKINRTELAEFSIALPPFSEQQAIAKALDDMDAQVHSLDQLIAKRRDIKQGAMQQLLTGEGRVEAEEQIMLGDLFEPAMRRKYLRNDDMVSFLGMEDVSEDGKILRHNSVPYSQIKKGLTYFERSDVLVAKITPCFENGKGACLDELQTEVGFGSTEFHVLRAKNNSTPRYIFYHSQTKRFRKRLEAEMTGTAGQKRVPASAIKDYALPINHTMNEQRDIAGILTDMDAEIEKLEQKRDKYKAIKQGMMQELLTGRTRLV